MLNYLSQFLSELLYLVNAMSPYLLLGFFFAGVLKVWFPQRWINRYMGKSNVKSVVNTAILGIPLPLCSCGVIPTGVSFYKNGASKGSSVSFLISTPQTGVDSVLVTYSMLGLPFAIIRIFVALITGVIGGIATNFAAKNDSDLDEEITSCSDSSNQSKGNSFIRLLKYGFNEFLMDIAKWLIIGIFIAAILSTIIPEDFFTLYLHNEALSMITILLASVPLYLCATASVPIAAVLMMKGLSPGAALILLMAGPATNAATITIIKKVFGSRTLISYLTSIIGGAILFGFLINQLLPGSWFIVEGSSHLHHQHELLPYWIKLASSIILISLIVYGYIGKYLKNTNTNIRKVESFSINENYILNNPSTSKFSSSQFLFTGNLKSQVFRVEKMTCSHCKASVETNLKKIQGVTSVVANPQLNKVEVFGDNFNKEDVAKTVTDLGYDFKGVYA